MSPDPIRFTSEEVHAHSILCIPLLCGTCFSFPSLPRRSHYTERKKCGPRSGQKASKGPRRMRVSTPPQVPPGDQVAMARHDAAGAPSPAVLTANTRLVGESLDWNCGSMRLGPMPPVHTARSMSNDELSGETTAVDYTDISDAPPQRILSRDGSGSSWWSLEEQHVAPASTPDGAVTMAAWNVPQQRYHNYPPQYRYPPQPDSLRRDAVSWASGTGSVAVGGGARGGASGSSGVSNGSEGESFEDDTSEEGLGQTEEEVAALLIRLGQARTFTDTVAADQERTSSHGDKKTLRAVAVVAGQEAQPQPKPQQVWGDGVRGRGS